MIAASVKVQIQFYHLDPMEVVWHGNYPRFFEKARCALLDAILYNYQAMRESKYMWPVVDMRVKYIRPLFFGQIVNVEARLVEYEHRLKIQYILTDNETGEIVTKGFTIQVAVDFETQEMLYESPKILIQKVQAVLCA